MHFGTSDVALAITAVTAHFALPAFDAQLFSVLAFRVLS